MRAKASGGGAVPVFACVLGGLLLFVWGAAMLARGELVAYCGEDVDRRLDAFLAGRSQPVRLSGSSRDGLQGLSFVRLVGEKEQYLYSDEPGLDLDVEDVVNLDPRTEADWISLADPQSGGAWTVRSRQAGANLLVQAGRRHDEIVMLWRRLTRVAAAMSGVAVLLALGAAWYSRRQSRWLVREAERLLEAAEGEAASRPPTAADLAPLAGKLTALLSRNARLMKEMEQSLDNVAHDLRTPMTRLRSVAEYGLREGSGTKALEALADCLEESERVLAMLDIMMSVAEAESGTMRLQRSVFDLAETVADAVNLYEYLAEEEGIAIEVDVAAHLLVAGDAGRLTRVWANLVDNAVKYGRRGGYLRISGRAEGGFCTLVFEDNGIGISESEIERIWERLFRGDRSRSRQGLGLGLNYVRAVVEAHGGEVEVTSRLGKGSRFSVRLPAVQP